MEGAVGLVFLGADGSGPFAVTGPPGNAGLPVQGVLAGSVAPGAPAAGENPVLTAGVDGGGIVRTLLTDATGRLVTAPVQLPATYSAFIGVFTSPANWLNADPVFALINGSATKLVKILRLEISIGGSAASGININLGRAAAAPSGGAVVAAVANDTTNPAPTARVASYIATPIPQPGGTGQFYQSNPIIPAAGLAVITIEKTASGQPITLRGVNDTLVLFTFVNTSAPVTFAVNVIFTEE
jgi:hypothetical protein